MNNGGPILKSFFFAALICLLALTTAFIACDAPSTSSDDDDDGQNPDVDDDSDDDTDADDDDADDDIDIDDDFNVDDYCTFEAGETTMGGTFLAPAQLEAGTAYDFVFLLCNTSYSDHGTDLYFFRTFDIVTPSGYSLNETENPTGPDDVEWSYEVFNNDDGRTDIKWRHDAYSDEGLNPGEYMLFRFNATTDANATDGFLVSPTIKTETGSPGLNQDFFIN